MVNIDMNKKSFKYNLIKKKQPFSAREKSQIKKTANRIMYYISFSGKCLDGHLCNIDAIISY